MTTKQLFITTLVISLFVFGGITAAIFWKQQDTIPQPSNLPTASSTSSENESGGLAVAGGEMGQLQEGLSIEGPTTTEATTNSPEQFGQYEQYKESTSALYADIQKGSGKAIEAGSKVAIYYKAWLTDGTMFDQSRKGEDGTLQPFMFTVGAHEVIPGMEQAIFGMKAGGTRRLIIPPSVGYGEQGQQDVIPPNAVLIFDVQLLAVQ